MPRNLWFLTPFACVAVLAASLPACKNQTTFNLVLGLGGAGSAIATGLAFKAMQEQ